MANTMMTNKVTISAWKLVAMVLLLALFLTYLVQQLPEPYRKQIGNLFWPAVVSFVFKADAPPEPHKSRHESPHQVRPLARLEPPLMLHSLQAGGVDKEQLQHGRGW